MRPITVQALIQCSHCGVVTLFPSQLLVRISGSPVLVSGDLLLKPITLCPNLGTTIKPCTLTMMPSGGHSSLVRINGRAVCLDSLTGLTDGTPPGVADYAVKDPGQHLVTER